MRFGYGSYLKGACISPRNAAEETIGNNVNFLLICWLTELTQRIAFHDYVNSSQEYEVGWACMVGESGEEVNAPALTAAKQEVRCSYASSKAS